MKRHLFVLFSTFVLIAGLPRLVPAQENAAELLPDSTVIYMEVSNPAPLINGFLEHSLAQRLQRLEAVQAMKSEQKFRDFKTALSYVESQLNQDWDEALIALTKNGVSFAVDASSQGAALIVRADDTETLEKMKATFLKIARQDAMEKGKEDPFKEQEYRGLTAYGNSDGGFTTYENWLILSNKAEFGKTLIDALLDEPAESLATQEKFLDAKKLSGNRGDGWMYVDVEMLRDAGVAEKLFSGKADDPAGEILLGGILETLKTALYVSGQMQIEPDEVSLTISMPHKPGEISEDREHYFGPRGTGAAAPLIEVPERMLAVSAHRNLADMWLRAGDLFDEKTNDQMAKAETGLSTLFAGRDFAEDILGAFGPHVQVIIARQTFADDQPIPAIKLPGFALVAEMNEPDLTRKEFRRLFISAIGFFNVIGAMNGQPQLELDFENIEEASLVTTTVVPEVGKEEEQDARINFNFSPSVAFTNELMVIASNSQLARELSQAKRAESELTTKDQVTNTLAKISAEFVREALADNREHLINQNMLEEGHTREEAEREVGTLLVLLELIEEFTFKLTTDQDSLNLKFNLELAE